MEGKILGNRYELLEKIGEGGMAVVYKAKCKLLNRYVAVKILKPEYGNDQELVQRFQIEAQAAASLSNINIVSIYDVGCEGDMHYIVMEYVDGETLKDYIARKHVINWEEALAISAQICSAIEHAHKNKIIHRDIKPHNILLSKSGVVKVTDFGIARATSTATMTMAGKTMGSVHYFSPEQARGGFVDEKSDLYSLGIVMYEMLVGHVPFDAESPVAVALKHIQDDAKDLISENPEIPVGVNSLVMKAINKQQSCRYQSATELIVDINRVLRDPTIVIDYSKVGIDNTIFIPSIAKGEEKEEVLVDKKKEKRVKLYATLTAVAIMIATVLACIKIILPIIGVNNRVAQEFIVDNYVGRNFYEVKGELKNRNIQVVDVERVNDDFVPRDVIISQNRQKGEKLKPGGFNSTIEFVVSNGAKKIKVPDLRRDEKKEAIATLEELGLDCDILEEYDQDIVKGRVTKTVPAYGNEVELGSTITVYISKGREVKYVVVPDVIGCTKDQAEKIIKASGLVVGDLYLTMDEDETDLVERQEPMAGEEVEEKSFIDIYFIKNPKFDKGTKVKVPDLKGKDKEEAKAIIEELELDFDIIEEYDNDVEKDKVIKTEPAYGNEVELGNTVTVYISKGRDVKYVDVPSVVGYTKERAEKIIKASGLVVGDLYLTAKKDETDLVEKQEPKAGEKVEENTTVDMYFTENPKANN